MIQLYRPVYKIPSPFVYAKRDADGMSFNLITQGFGECLPSVCQWYKDLGLVAHNGLDFMVAYVDCFAAHDGEVFKVFNKDNSSPTAGYGVYIRHAEGWYTLYFHLSAVEVKVGDKLKAGDFIGTTGNSGKYTKGPHLHFGLYPANPDRSNGYDGAIDPIKYFSIEEISGIINQPNKKTMLKIIGGSGTKKQYVVGKDGVAHWISYQMMKDLLSAGEIDPATIVWLDKIENIGSQWGVII